VVEQLAFVAAATNASSVSEVCSLCPVSFKFANHTAVRNWKVSKCAFFPNNAYKKDFGFVAGRWNTACRKQETARRERRIDSSYQQTVEMNVELQDFSQKPKSARPCCLADCRICSATIVWLYVCIRCSQKNIFNRTVYGCWLVSIWSPFWNLVCDCELGGVTMTTESCKKKKRRSNIVSY